MPKAYRIFRAIMLNPNFPINDIHVYDATIDTSLTILPTYMYKLVVVIFAIKNGLAPYWIIWRCLQPALPTQIGPLF